MTAPVVVGRQALQDREGVTVGYELLFRADRTASSAAAHLDGDEMTAEVTLSTLDIGLEEVLCGRPAFCNADRGMLLGEVPIVLPPGRAVIEVLETVHVDEEVLAGCRRLVDQGYDLALDDFVGFDGDEALLQLATVVKVDVRQSQGADLVALVERCRPYGVRLLAEKVETGEEHRCLLDLGFDLFQGYHLERPVVMTGRRLAPSSLSKLRLAAMLIGGDVDADDLMELLHGDPGLATQVMKLAALGRPGETRRKVTTIREALVLAGSRAVQNWLALLSLRQAAEDSSMRFVDVLVRARAVQVLAAQHSPAHQEMGFTAGMLSALDLLVGVAPEDLRSSLPIGDDLAEAAFGAASGEAPPSRLRRLVESSIDFQLHGRTSSRPCTPGLDEAFAEAFAWTARVVEHIGDPSLRTA